MRRPEWAALCKGRGGNFSAKAGITTFIFCCQALLLVFDFMLCVRKANAESSSDWDDEAVIEVVDAAQARPRCALVNFDIGNLSY